MPRRKDVTYYVGRVTWGMIMTQQVKEKRKNIKSCKVLPYLRQERHFLITDQQSLEKQRASFFPFLNIFSS